MENQGAFQSYSSDYEVRVGVGYKASQFCLRFTFWSFPLTLSPLESQNNTYLTMTAFWDGEFQKSMILGEKIFLHVIVLNGQTLF